VARAHRTRVVKGGLEVWSWTTPPGVSCEKKKKKKKKNTSPFIISRFAPESQVFFEKFFKKIFTIFIDFCFRI
jgi:hypothetical protein